MKIKFIALVAAFSLGLTGVQAQKYDYKAYPYNFAGAQAGAQVMLLNFDHLKLVTPIGGAYFGSMFSPYYGIRLSAQGAWSKMGFKPSEDTYSFNYVTGCFDVLFNVSNLFTKNYYHRFHTFLIGGVGMTYAWDFDNVPLMATKPWNERRYTTNWRVGVMEEMNLSKHLAVNLEVDLNNLNDRLIGPEKGRNDWQLVGMLGLTYKFGLKKNYKKAEPTPDPIPQTLYEQMQAVVNERMNTWMKRLKGESEEDYLCRTSGEAFEIQRLMYIKTVSTEMAGNRANTSLKEMRYNKNSETLGVFFNDMPTITLKVPVSEIKYMKGKEEL